MKVCVINEHKIKPNHAHCLIQLHKLEIFAIDGMGWNDGRESFVN